MAKTLKKDYGYTMNKHEVVIVRFGGGGLSHVYAIGYFCQGPESSGTDGLICSKDVDGEPLEIREVYLSPILPLSEVSEALKVKMR